MKHSRIRQPAQFPHNRESLGRSPEKQSPQDLEILGAVWLRGLDLNQRPLGYEWLRGRAGNLLILRKKNVTTPSSTLCVDAGFYASFWPRSGWCGHEMGAHSLRISVMLNSQIA